MAVRCDQPVADFAQTLVCARQYASRWLTKDCHKALKTGLGAERGLFFQKGGFTR